MAVNIEGVRVLYPTLHRDGRGYFFESWTRDANIGFHPVQSNVSFSYTGVLRGMHFHLQQADFWVVARGHVRAVLYDMRGGSSTAGRAMTIELRGDEPCGLYIPPRVAHGFYAIENTVMTYLVDRYYLGGADERGIRWDDPAFVTAWGDIEPVLSERDRNNPGLNEISVFE